MKKLLSIILALTMITACAITSSAQSSQTYQCGDVDRDNLITIMDATYIQNHLAQIITLDSEQLLLADTNSNSSVEIDDATIIQKYLSDYVDMLPYDAEFDTYLKNVAAAQGDNTLTLSILTDLHYDENDPKIVATKAPVFENFKKFQDNGHSDFTANLGDFVMGNADKQTTVTSLNTIIDITEDISLAPVLNVRGNHDDNGWYSYGNYGGSFKPDEIINDKEWHEIAMADRVENFVFDQNNPYGGYGYIDHYDSKTRIFVLNSCDLPYILDENGSYKYNSYQGHAFSSAQLNFVARALNFSDKKNPNEWAALFLTHVPLDTSNKDNERFGVESALIRGHDVMLSIITAYKNGTDFSFNDSVYVPQTDDRDDFLVDVSCDYTEKGCGEVIAFFSGHTHSTNYTNVAGIEESLSYGYTFIGSCTSESFINYVINRDTKTISAFSYGDVWEEKREGTIVTDVHTGSIKDGVWSVTYDQFLPDGENMSNGMSEVFPLHYFIDSSKTTCIDFETLEVDGAIKISSPTQITKAIQVKPLTTYVLPDEFNGNCVTFGVNGDRKIYLKVVEKYGKKTITTAQRTAYVAFSINTSSYKDYENFTLTEYKNPYLD